MKKRKFIRTKDGRHRQPSCCTNSLCVLEDKTTKFIIQNRVEATVIGDTTEVRIFDTYVLPKLYMKLLPEGCPPQPGTVLERPGRTKQLHPNLDPRSCPKTPANAQGLQGFLTLGQDIPGLTP
ncbi:40S ribosomal protein S26-like [Sciurus carolinensis]|uniref:40S ribosomal protein S26-like n=1 Tax=Sciurus carolinensis TaxID=30640 RepID=UPI001FB48C93|nr:40S ribosomal protein S26-like [Sciurus carolinensis]